MHARIGNRSGFDALEFCLLSEHQNGTIETLRGALRVVTRNKLHAHLDRVRMGDVKNIIWMIAQDRTHTPSVSSFDHPITEIVENIESEVSCRTGSGVRG